MTCPRFVALIDSPKRVFPGLFEFPFKGSESGIAGIVDGKFQEVTALSLAHRPGVAVYGVACAIAVMWVISTRAI